MPISCEEFIEYYPRLYHMAEHGTWPSIRRHGLRSTTALLDLFSINGDRRRQLESHRRPKSEQIQDIKLGVATIRDQGPMSDSALRKCLHGMTPRQWYELLNRRVFFWVTEKRVKTLLTAKRYRRQEHTVITLDTAGVLDRYIKKITLSPINSGSTLYVPQPRGPNTFLPLDRYPFADRRKKRGILNAVAELAIEQAMLDILDHTIRVEHRCGPRIIEVLYERAAG
jgi:hypothetical protein